MNMSSAMITFSPESRTLSVSTKALDTPVGNISPASAALLLSRALTRVTNPDGNFVRPVISRGAAYIFLQQRPNTSEAFQIGGGDRLTLLTASEISGTIGAYVSSAAKAWADGYWGVVDRRASMEVDAIEEVQSLALVGSLPLTIAAGVLGVILLGLVVGQLRTATGEGEPLGIGSLVRVWEQRHAMRE
jgi:hypothetical protein